MFDLTPLLDVIPKAVPIRWDPAGWEQALLVLATFGFKAAHMALALALVLLLARRKERDLALLRNGLAALFLGEAACAVGYWGSCDDHHVLELLHVLGMIGVGALIPYGLFALLDERVLRLTDPAAGCAAARFCQPCAKHGATICPANRLFLLLAVALAILLLVPLLAPLRPLKNEFVVYGTLVTHGAGARRMIWEMRVWPGIGLAAALAAAACLLPRRPALLAAQRLFFLALGCASYALLRFFLWGAFRDRLGWADIWEETTELLLVLTVAVVLWLWRAPLGVRAPWRRA